MQSSPTWKYWTYHPAGWLIALTLWGCPSGDIEPARGSSATTSVQPETHSMDPCGPTVTPVPPLDVPAPAGPSPQNNNVNGGDPPILPEPGAPQDGNTPACLRTTGRRIDVRTSEALTQALAQATANDVITLADGTYTGAFVATAQGTPHAPIALCGTGNATLVGPSLTAGYTLHLNQAAYWTVANLTISGGAKGVMLDGAKHNTLWQVTVHDIGSEGIHLRTHSSDNVVDRCTVYNTGMAGNPMFGEGIYIGSSKNNWCTLTAGQADRSDNNTISNCHIYATTSENIDIKEGTQGGHITGNMLDGQKMRQDVADSLIDIKGNGFIFTHNTLQRTPMDAISIHVLLPGWGACNTFANNTLKDTCPGYGIRVAAPKPLPATGVATSNTAPGAALGLTNIPTAQNITAGGCPAGVLEVVCNP